MDATRLPPPAEAPATVPDQATPVGGRFVPLGEGEATPTGVVSIANDLQGGGQVALKLVPPEVLPTATMADRALRELKQLAKVTSDRIVRVVDQGRLPDGRIYVATERADGVTLETLIGRDGPLPPERAKAIVLAVGEALTEAQKVGVIHRDVNPRNVLVGANDRVKVADFGLAEPVTDKVFGSPAFVSPEQAEGKPVDQRSNIYSLGAMYYYALTGQTPFIGDSASLLQQHVSVSPPAASSKRPGLSADIDRVIAKALEKNGGRRHLTLRQLLTEIGATSTGAATAVRADAQARTMMVEAPVIPSPAPPVAQPARSGAGAQTVLGMPAVVPGNYGLPATPVAAATPAPAMPAPISSAPPPISSAPPPTAPSVPAVPSVIVEPPPAAPISSAPPPSTPALPAAPSVIVQPQAPAPQPVRAAPQAATMMAEAPRLPQTAAPQAATMMAEAPRVPQPSGAPAATVMADVSRAQPASAAPSPGKNDTGKKKGFRETAWFKRGEIEEEMAKAQAAGGTGKHGLVDENIDVSKQDQARLSLKTGATQAMPVIGGKGGLPGERMDEAEMLAEISSSRKYFFIAGAVVVAIVLGLVLFFATRGGSPKAEAPPADKPAPVAASPPASPPPAAIAAAVVPSPTAPSATPPSPSSPAVTPSPAAAPAGAGAPSSGLTSAVEKAEAAPTTRDLRRLERAVTLDLKTAHRKRDRATEATDRQLLVRLHKAERRAR